MTIKVLGTGCKKCNDLYDNVQSALNAKGVTASVEKVEALQDIMVYGVMSTPALVVDGKVVATGKVLSASAIEKLL